MSDITLAKLATIQRCLQRIRDVTGGQAARVQDIDVQDIVVLNLQRAIQAAIDLAARIISHHGWGLPDSLKAHFTMLTRQGVIDTELCARLEVMVGFRNIAIHDYEALDVNILQRIVAERLPDLDAFAAAVSRFMEREGTPQ